MQRNQKWLILFLIWLMMLVAYFDRIDMAVAGPSLMAALHLSKSQFGWALAAFSVGYAAMQVPGGAIADKIGARPLLIAAILLWSAFTALTGLAASFVSLLAIRVVFGVGEGIEGGPQFKLIGDHFTAKERSSANAIFLSAIALGPAFGTPVAAWVIREHGWRQLFFVFAIPGLVLALLLFLFLPKEARIPAEPSHQADGVGKHFRDTLRNPAAWCCAAGYLLFNATFWGFLSWVPTYLTDQRHITLTKMGFAGSIPYFCGFVGMISAGRLGATKLVDRRAGLISACFLLAALFLYFAVQTTQPNVCIAWLSVAAFFIYGSFGPFWSVTIGLAAPAVRGAFTGFVNFCGQVGAFSAQILIGHLADKMHSFDGAIFFMVGTITTAAVAMIALQRMGQTDVG